jgi:hypothetical protein
MSGLKMQISSWGEVVLDKRRLKALMRSAGTDIKSKTARLIGQTTGTGRAYRGGGGSAYRGNYRPGRYRASEPGQPPVILTGTLRQSLRVYPFPSGEGFAVRERAFYALFLEAGARGGGNPYGARGRPAAATVRLRKHRARGRYTTRVLLPRPHLDRVMKEQEPALEKRVETALYQGMTWRQTKDA